ncbi:MAG: flavin reductase [Deltaproteobacteria bacterium]|nr:MAG: flavin reductase [Deltaproteobacteria bacterium]
MEKQWQDALSKMAYGIYVLTTKSMGHINGMIASWVCQVSHDPPLILVAVHPNRRTHAMLLDSKSFVLHILSSEQKDLMSRFKGPDPEAKFEGLHWEAGSTGCPILKQCVAYLECNIKETYRPGNHTLFVGEIINGAAIYDAPVLTTLQYGGTYTGEA